MNRRTIRITLLVTGWFSAPSQTSAEIAPLSASELYSSCAAYRDDAESAAGQACSGYVRGLLDGMRNPATTDSRPPGRSFSERALRTRAGSRYAALMRPCVGASLSLEQLVGELLAQRLADAADTPASDVVYGTLRRFENCRAD